MKNLLLSAIATLFVSSVFASTISEDPIPVFANTSRELSHLLNSYHSDDVLEKEESVKVIFTVNELHQLVVLHVNSENSDIQYYIEHVLNYKKLPSNELIVGEKYIFEAIFKD